MKGTLFLLTLLLATVPQIKAQSSGSDSLTVQPRLVLVTTTIKTYSFVSLRKIQPDKEDRIAGRLRQAYPDIAAISIREQQVTLSLNTNTSKEVLSELFWLFGYKSYKIK
jgi:hypothetical protein